jgi:hypothetical protein
MDAEALYSILIDCGRFFLTGWVVLILLASVIVFRQDLS